MKETYKRPSSEVQCDYCGSNYMMENREVSRTESLGRNKSCSPRCSKSLSMKNKIGRSVGFGFYANSARQRSKRNNLEFNLDQDYLFELFNNQEGKCCVTGFPMKLNSNKFSSEDKNQYYASLDRIDSSIGYVKGNVQFICLAVNYMKNTFSMEDTVSFIERIKM